MKKSVMNAKKIFAKYDELSVKEFLKDSSRFKLVNLVAYITHLKEERT